MMLEQQWYNRLGSARLGALLVTLALLAWMLLAVPPAGAQTNVDYDTDDDRLIEIDSLDKLNAIRYDENGDGLRGTVSVSNWMTYTAAFPNASSAQCPTGCQGYELTANLTFPASGAHSAWTPIGGQAANTIFDGNGHTLTDLKVSHGGHSGLFTAASGTIRRVGMVNPTVTVTVVSDTAGALVGYLNSTGTIESSYARGGTITASPPSNQAVWVGGLIGETDELSTVRAVWSSATVATTRSSATRMGGLVGALNGSLSACFSYGNVASTASGNTRGGLIGRGNRYGSVSNCYYNSSTAGQTAGIGTRHGSFSGSAGARTTRELRRPTGYTGIYANWNIDLDGDPMTDDDPWDFGSRRHYPLLKVDKDGDGTPTCLEFSGQPCYVYVLPEPPPYDWRADHPEIYQNPRHEMATSCAVETTGTGDDAKSTSTLTFDLGNYTRPLTLALSLWDGTHFRSLQSQNIAMPALQQTGQTAMVEVATDPAQTRFRIDSEYGLNLVLGYADCHTDDPEE